MPPFLPCSADWIPLDVSTRVTGDDQDIGPWLLAAFATVLYCGPTGPAFFKDCIAELAHGPFHIRALADHDF